MWLITCNIDAGTTPTLQYQIERENIQSAYWPGWEWDVSRMGITKVKTGWRCCVLDYFCSKFIFISWLVASLYRPLHIYSTLPLSEYKAFMAKGSFQLKRITCTWLESVSDHIHTINKLQGVHLHQDHLL